MVTCLVWALDKPETINQTYEVGGSEYFSLAEAARMIMEITRQRRLLVSWPSPLLRLITVTIEAAFPRFPASVFWLDYLAVNRTCGVNTIQQVFGLMPARFNTRLEHLRGIRWGPEFFRRTFSRHA
jgi:nucleoside-diphosphate-sugar epimerase